MSLGKDELPEKFNKETQQVLLDTFNQRFALEHQRKDTIESKASMVLGFSGFISGMITGLIASIDPTKIVFLILFGASIACFTTAGVLSLLVIKLMKYNYPSSPMSLEDIDKAYGEKPEEIKDDVVKNLSICILNNSVLNTKKANRLLLAFYSATAGVILILVSAIIYFVGV